MKKAHKDINLVDLDKRMIEFLLDLENRLGYELTVTSGYRSPLHPIEAAKERAGEHSTGLAVDVASIGGNQTYTIVKEALQLGCMRIGINRNKNFIHLGLDSSRVTSIWTY